ncbi:MAG: DUF350 domain-containing protein [Thermoplasmatota archaeon]
MALSTQALFETGLGDLLQLLLALLFSVLSVYAGVRVFARAAPNTREVEELKRGNVAVGVVLGASILSIAILVRGLLLGLGDPLVTPRPAVLWTEYVIIAILLLFLGVALGMALVRAAFWAFDHLSQGLHEEVELQRGNLAVGVAMAGALIAVSIVLSDTLGHILASWNWSP